MLPEEHDTSQIVRGTWLGKIGINIRGLVVLVLCVTVCVLTAIKIPIAQELFWLTSAAVTYYFGQQHDKRQ